MMGLAVAKNWFQTKTINKWLTCISEQHCSRYLTGNAWFIEGNEQCLLVDTCSGLSSIRGFIESITDKPVIAVALNCFYDHAGGLYEFDQCWAHEDDADSLLHPTAETSVAGEYVTPAMMRMAPQEGFDIAEYHLRGAALTRQLKNEDVLDLDEMRFRFLHTPGVTPGSLCVYEETTQSLFTSDTYFYNANGPNALPRDAARYVVSKQRLSKLKINSIYPGHFDPVTAHDGMFTH